MKNGISQFKELAIISARKAGEILKENFGKVKNIKSKGKTQLVSNVDLEAEKVIIENIKEHFPEHSILSEENPQLNNSEYKWIIDPLDGTHNFVKNIPIFGTSIALEYKNEVVLGVIYFPLDGRLYWAEKGKGAYLNGKRLKVSDRKLSSATCVYDSSIRYSPEEMSVVLKNLSTKVFNIRMFGSTAEHLALLAEGRIDLDIEFNDQPWDFAGGALIVKEAGGEFTDFKGNPWHLKMPNYLASNGIVHQEVLEIIQGSLRK
ncbi:MAG: inositol monophosphatase [Candidatus Omnitrophica bacterium]|nr:inositol monophosphatase [Candidatus Omnitrophota bacterium]